MNFIYISFNLIIYILTTFFSTLAWSDTTVPQVILVQNSGWMLPFYDDPNSKFKDIILELSRRLTPYSSDLIIASFNQSVGENKSPQLLYRGSDENKIRDAIKSIAVVKKPGKQSFADTDFKEAIIGAITQFSPGKSCLLWIITNNKNSPDNSPETVEKNKEFYKFLQESVEIMRIIAFPHSLKVQSQLRPDYSANGLMFYALAYGQPAELLLQKMLAINAPFGKQPARLKPLNMEALTFIPNGVKNKDVRINLANDHKTLVMTFSADSKPEEAELTGQFRNDFYPYDIQSAIIDINTYGFKAQGDENIEIRLSSNEISNIPAGGVSPTIGVKIKVPAIPSPWDPEVIFGNGYKSNGVIRFELTDQKLSISQDFNNAMSELFPKDPLPDLFIPGESAKKSITTQNFTIIVEYPLWPLLLVTLVCLSIFGLIIWGLTIFRQEKIFRVSIDGIQKSYGMRPYTEIILKNQQGDRIGILKRGLRKATPIIDKGKSCTVRLI
jgi:hypothetical protein